MSPRVWLRLFALSMIAAGLGLAAWLHGASDVEWTRTGFEAFVSDLGWWGPALIIAVMALRFFLGLPSWLVMTAAGFLFGVGVGTLCVVVGGTIGAWIAFAVARAFGREWVVARIGGPVERLDLFLTEKGSPWLATYVALPVSVLTPVFFVAGLSGMRALALGASAAAGFAPRGLLFTLLGQTAGAPDMQSLALASVAVLLSIGAVFWGRRYVFRMNSGR